MKHFSLLFCFSILVSCGSDDTIITGTIMQSAYYPLAVGQSQTYEIQEVIYHINQRDTISYLLREEVSAIDTGVTDLPVFIIDRYQKTEAGNDWTYMNREQAYFENNQVIRLSDGRRFVKLSLPAGDIGIWDGTALFDASATRTIGGQEIDYYKDWQSEIEGFESVWTLRDQTFQNVYRIKLVDLENKIELRKGIEYYAEDIGLVYRKLEILDTQCFEDCDHVPWTEKAEKGHIFTQTLLP